MKLKDLIFSEELTQPLKFIAAYESLWLQQNITFKKVADLFRPDVQINLTEFFTNSILEDTINSLKTELCTPSKDIDDIHVKTIDTLGYPLKLNDAVNPVKLLYYKGDWNLVNNKLIAIVGSRKPSNEGVRRATRLAKELSEAGFTIVSGLAEGIDTAAHNAAIKIGGKTIAVIGTPIHQYYPKKNKDLQDYISKNHLLISQIPILKYKAQDYRLNRLFFPERNATMCALTDATIIVEAGETSGTLTQAKAAIEQGRKLFILNNCFENNQITWPLIYEKKGAIRVRNIEDIIDNLRG